MFLEKGGGGSYLYIYLYYRSVSKQNKERKEKKEKKEQRNENYQGWYKSQNLLKYFLNWMTDRLLMVAASEAFGWLVIS